jgi:hypothetical protein
MAGVCHAMVRQVMPVEQLKLPPTNTGRISAAASPQCGGVSLPPPKPGAAQTVLIVAHSSHVPMWFFDDMINTGPHNGYCTTSEAGPRPAPGRRAPTVPGGGPPPPPPWLRRTAGVVPTVVNTRLVSNGGFDFVSSKQHERETVQFFKTQRGVRPVRTTVRCSVRGRGTRQIPNKFEPLATGARIAK